MNTIISTLNYNLRESVKELNSRGLFTAAKWSSEQLLGMSDVSPTNNNTEAHTHKNGFEYTQSYNDGDLINFAHSLLSLSEFQRCAFLFRENSTLKPFLSKKAIFIACYSMYMAGEKLKDQLSYESRVTSSVIDDKKSSSGNNIRNPYLNDLFSELAPLYDKYILSQTDAMDGFLLYMFATVLRDIRSKSQNVYFPDHDKLSTLPPTEQIYAEAIFEYPYNWSCWLDLASYCASESTPPPAPIALMATLAISSPPSSTSSSSLASSVPASFLLDSIEITDISYSSSSAVAFFAADGASKVTLLCFLFHFYTCTLKPQDSLLVYPHIQPLFPRSLWMHSQSALMYYHLRDFDASQSIFEDIRNCDPYRVQLLDIFSNILYVKENRAQLSHLAHILTKIDKFSPETCCVVGNYYSLIGQHEKAIVYFKRALKLNKNFLSACTLMGHEYIELRNTSAAIHCYRQALEISNIDYRAWYGLGQTYEILNLYQYALYYFRKAASLCADDARMWCAVGNCLHRLGLTDEAILLYEKAISLGDTEGVATRELARLYEESGAADKAAEVYQQFVDMEKVQADEDINIGSSREFNTQRDHNNKDGILFLAKYYRHRKKYNSVYFYCSRLLDLHGPEGEEARAMMREVRARVDVNEFIPGGVRVETSLLDYDDAEEKSRISVSPSDYAMMENSFEAHILSSNFSKIQLKTIEKEYQLAS